MLQPHIIKAWSQNKGEIELNFGACSPIRHNITIMNGVTMKDKWIIIPIKPIALQNQILDQLHNNHRVIKKT